MSGPKKGILYYWTIRYFLILFLSMLAVGATILLGIYIYATNMQKADLEKVMDDIVHTAAQRGGKLPEGRALERWLDDRSAEYGLSERQMLIILDPSGSPVQAYPQELPLESGELTSKLGDILSGKREFIKLQTERTEPLLAISAPINRQSDDRLLGYAVYLVYENKVLEGFLAFSAPRLAGWLTLMVCGWLILYGIIRRLAKPIQEVSAAAKQVVEGRYEVNLSKTYKEKEIDHLMTTFKEMAEQLRRVEELRTQLLAGVTHELKTPITSISGLIQAVHDRIVVDEEAEEFLQYSLRECNRLRVMVDDLLDFNQFAANSIQVSMGSYQLDDAIRNIVDIWKVSQDNASVDVGVAIAEGDDQWTIVTDIERFTQIMINLLNNARDAIQPDGAIEVRLTSERNRFLIQVEDTGKGIPETEHPNIFEPFYRGADKKSSIRGLGIGLPFSRMIAQALGGRLELAGSSPQGSCFALYLPRQGGDGRIGTRHDSPSTGH